MAKNTTEMTCLQYIKSANAMVFVARGHASTFTQTPHSGSATAACRRGGDVDYRSEILMSSLSCSCSRSALVGSTARRTARPGTSGTVHGHSLPTAGGCLASGADRRTALSGLIDDPRRSTTGRKSTVAAGLVRPRPRTRRDSAVVISISTADDRSIGDRHTGGKVCIGDDGWTEEVSGPSNRCFVVAYV